MCTDQYNGKLLSLGSSNGACRLACAAIDALVSLDLVFAVSSFDDSAGGTLGSASSAAQALVKSNFVCHDNYLQYIW